MSKPIICVGAILVDELIHAAVPILPATTVNAHITKTAGGVAHNIAKQLSILGVNIQLISVFGNDSDGDWLKQSCAAAGVKIDASITKEGISGRYTGVLNSDGSLYAAFLSNAAVFLCQMGPGLCVLLYLRPAMFFLRSSRRQAGKGG